MTGHLLYKMLPHGANLMSEGIRGSQALSAVDIAAALALGSLPKHAYYFGLTKYCNDDKAKLSFLNHLESKIQKTIHRRKWHDAEGRARGLALLVLLEGIYGLLCHRCKGRGFVLSKIRRNELRHQKSCERCNGSGVGQISDTQRAKIAKVATSNWIKTWKTRNEEFMLYAHGLDAKVLRHLKRQLQ